jgi:hypothetical protein
MGLQRPVSRMAKPEMCWRCQRQHRVAGTAPGTVRWERTRAMQPFKSPHQARADRGR